VLQIGADVYCDTRLIAITLEVLHPLPTLFPQGDRGLSLALTAWSDRSFFEPGAGLSMGLNSRGLPQAVIDDRKAFFNFMDFDALEEDIPYLATQFRAQADLVNEQLFDGRKFLLGDRPGLADINAYFPLWMARANFAALAAEMFLPFTGLLAWEERMRGVGHGQRMEISASHAHAVAREATPQSAGGVDEADALGLQQGEQVTVSADDYGRDPVSGELTTLSIHEVAIRRVEPTVGTVVVHFPRIGYRVTRG
jgi:glutathione S-transferase